MGLVYQFNKTIVETLRSEPNAVITIEGAIEDVRSSFEGPGLL
jgi:hypothetical protein